MKNPQRRTRGAVWHVTVPAALKAEYRRLYPGRRAMTIATIEAIKAKLLFHPVNSQLSNAEKASYIHSLTNRET